MVVFTETHGKRIGGRNRDHYYFVCMCALVWFGFVGIFSFYPLHVVKIYSWNQSSIYHMIPHRYVSHHFILFISLFLLLFHHSHHFAMIIMYIEKGNKQKSTFHFVYFCEWSFFQCRLFSSSAKMYYFVHLFSYEWIGSSNQHRTCMRKFI